MQLTEQDKEMFKSLASGALGRQLVDFLRRMEAHICDSRQWGPTDTREGSNRLASVIEKEVCDRIMLQNTKKSKEESNDYL